MDTTRFGLDQALFSSMEAGVIPARITAVHKERYEVISEKGTGYAVLKRGGYQGKNAAEEFPAVGDFVALRPVETGDSLITRTLPRKSRFCRTNFSGHAAGYVKTVLEQTVAANFDYVFLMSSLNHDFKVARMERYLTMARYSGAMPVIVLTKADVAVEGEEKLSMARAVAGAAPVYVISAHTGEGMKDLYPYFAPGKTAVFLGSSGVGKSSLVNALAGEMVMAVNDIREDDSKGRHTTTHRQMIFLPGGAMVIDTPGLRELGVVWEAEEGVAQTFEDVEQYMGRCRFSDCKHQSEPGCAIRAAVESGALKRERFERYQSLVRETRFVAKKAKPDPKVSGRKPKGTIPYPED